MSNTRNGAGKSARQLRRSNRVLQLISYGLQAVGALLLVPVVIIGVAVSYSPTGEYPFGLTTDTLLTSLILGMALLFASIAVGLTARIRIRHDRTNQRITDIVNDDRDVTPDPDDDSSVVPPVSSRFSRAQDRFEAAANTESVETQSEPRTSDRFLDARKRGGKNPPSYPRRDNRDTGTTDAGTPFMYGSYLGGSDDSRDFGHGHSGGHGSSSHDSSSSSDSGSSSGDGGGGGGGE